MAKHKYVLVGPDAGATGAPVIKELMTYEGDALTVDGSVVTIADEHPYVTVAVIRLAEGQSIKQKE